MLALRLPDGTEQRLADLAKVTGRSKSYYARQAIVEHIDEIESRARAEMDRTSGEKRVRVYRQFKPGENNREQQ